MSTRWIRCAGPAALVTLGACVADRAPRTASAPGASGAAVNPEFLRRYAETYRFGAGRPKSVTVAPNASGVLFLRSGPRSPVQDLYEFDMGTGRERVLLTADQILAGAQENLSAEELARRERLRLSARGIAGYTLSDDGARLLVPLSGRLFVVERASGRVTELKSEAGFPLDPTFSPDASSVACVRGAEVYVTDLSTGAERRLTSGAGGAISHGEAEFVAQEEMDRHRGYWWSPDARFIAFQRTDTSGMEMFHIADPLHPEREPQSWPYPRAGGKNADVTLGIVSVTGGAPVWVSWDRAAFPYLASVTWAKNAPPTILVQNREQTHEALLAVDPGTGATRPLLEERDPAWINLFQSCPKWLEDGSGFLWITERPGWITLELRAPDGALVRELAGRDIGLVDLAALDPRAGVAYVSASTEPTESHVWSVPLSGGTPTRLTREQGHHSVSFAKDFSASVRSANLVDGTLSQRVFRAEGSSAGELASAAEEPPFIPRIELARVGERDLRAAIIRPRTFTRGVRYPVLVSVYGGPHSNTVSAAARGYVFQQWMADQGFIVVTLDGRGTPRRGRDWERCIKNDLSLIPLEDQAAGLAALGAKHPEMDLTRVGIYGWSFGGYFSAMATMRRPDVYRAGFAGAPVADWRDYDTHYTERYMGLPDANRAGYDAANVLSYCKDLRVPLLVAHGTADDNVYFLHSLKITDALTRSGRTCEFTPLPGFTHMVAEPDMTERLWSRVAAFFKRELGSPVGD